MSKKNLNQAEVPDIDEFEGVIGDPDYDYLSVLESNIPYFRNLMAHGWPKIILGSSVGTLMRCAEFINQLFQPQPNAVGKKEKLFILASCATCLVPHKR